jgi:hypothetical protein
MNEELSGPMLRRLVASLNQVIAIRVAVSEGSNGIEADARGHWVNALYGRLCLNAMTVLGMMVDGVDGLPMDHYSIVIISRSAFEVCLMIAYLTTENISPSEQELKMLTLRIHDTVSRLRFFKGFERSAQVGLFRQDLDELRKAIRQNSFFQRLEQPQQTDLISGKTVFIGGIRSVVREVGMSVDQFDSLYAYFSTYVHSMPMSFFRSREHEISYAEPSDPQIVVSGIAVELVEFSLTRAGRRLIGYFSVIRGKVGEATMKEFDKLHASVHDFSKQA